MMRSSLDEENFSFPFRFFVIHFFRNIRFLKKVLVVGGGGERGGGRMVRMECVFPNSPRIKAVVRWCSTSVVR